MVRDLMRSDRGMMPSLASPLSRVIDQFFEDPFLALAPVALTRDQGSFALDLSEDDNSFIVRATLPGFTQEDVNVEVNDGVLTISAQHDEEEDKGERYFRRERRWGSVQRQIVLPSPVEEDRATAELKDGVLTLRMPKVQKAPPKRINIGSQPGREQGRPREKQRETSGAGGNTPS
jgi:HSP20 family protein